MWLIGVNSGGSAIKEAKNIRLFLSHNSILCKILPIAEASQPSALAYIQTALFATTAVHYAIHQPPTPSRHQANAFASTYNQTALFALAFHLLPAPVTAPYTQSPIGLCFHIICIMGQKYTFIFCLFYSTTPAHGVAFRHSHIFACASTRPHAFRPLADCSDKTA